MKKIITLIVLVLSVMWSLFALNGTTVEVNTEPTRFKPTDTVTSATHQFSVTFEGSEEGVLYYDFGFSKVPTTLTSSGLSKGTIDNNAITMAVEGTYSGNTTYNYTASVYTYWYCSFNQAYTLKMAVKAAEGSKVTFKYTPYTYALTTNSSNVSSLDGSGTAGDQTTATASSGSTATVDLAVFGNAIAVYNGNSYVEFEAEVSKYPTNGVVATVTLSLEAKT